MNDIQFCVQCKATYIDYFNLLSDQFLVAVYFPLIDSLPSLYTTVSHALCSPPVQIIHIGCGLAAGNPWQTLTQTPVSGSGITQESPWIGTCGTLWIMSRMVGTYTIMYSSWYHERVLKMTVGYSPVIFYVRPMAAIWGAESYQSPSTSGSLMHSNLNGIYGILFCEQ